MTGEFGPSRDEKSAYPQVFKANAIIGNFLRFELLSRYNEKEKLLDEVKGYYGTMAKITGTLWEHNDTRASTNHGFASHVAFLFYRDILGIKSIDPNNKNIVLSFAELP